MFRARASALVRALLAALVGLAPSACGGEVARQRGVEGAGGGAEGCGAIAAHDGDYFLALTLTDAPGVPAPYLATLQRSSSGTTVALLPLNADDRQSVAIDGETGLAHGDQLFGPFPVDSAGQVTFVLSQAAMPGDTNPLTMNDLVVDAVLEGRFCRLDADSICGDFEAQVTHPFALPLEGTWTMTPLVNGKHREPPPLDCAGNLAAPL